MYLTLSQYEPDGRYTVVVGIKDGKGWRPYGAFVANARHNEAILNISVLSHWRVVQEMAELLNDPKRHARILKVDEILGVNTLTADYIQKTVEAGKRAGGRTVVLGFLWRIETCQFLRF